MRRGEPRRHDYPGCLDRSAGCSNEFNWRVTIALGWLTLIISAPIFAVTIHRQLFWRAQQATYYAPRRLEALLTSALVKDDADDGGTDDDDGGRNDSGDGFAAMELSGRRARGRAARRRSRRRRRRRRAAERPTRLSYKARKLASSRRRANAAMRHAEAAKAAAMGGAEVAALPAGDRGDQADRRHGWRRRRRRRRRPRARRGGGRGRRGGGARGGKGTQKRAARSRSRSAKKAAARPARPPRCARKLPELAGTVVLKVIRHLFALYLLVTDIEVPARAERQLDRIGDALYNFFGFIDLSGLWRLVERLGDYFEHVWVLLSERINIDVECPGAYAAWYQLTNSLNILVPAAALPERPAALLPHHAAQIWPRPQRRGQVRGRQLHVVRVRVGARARAARRRVVEPAPVLLRLAARAPHARPRRLGERLQRPVGRSGRVPLLHRQRGRVDDGAVPDLHADQLLREGRARRRQVPRLLRELSVRLDARVAIQFWKRDGVQFLNTGAAVRALVDT